MDGHFQIGGHARDVDLVAQAAGERVDGPLGVVSRPVEAAVDDRLDTAAQRLEERGDDERRGRDGDGSRRSAVEDRLETEHDDHEDERRG